MKVNRFSMAALAGLVWLTAAAPSAGDTAPDPCSLLTDDEVRRVFPGSNAGRLDRSQENSLGILSCVWNSSTGTFGIMTSDDEAEPSRKEAETWTLMFLDPLRRDAARHVRYETLTGVGDEAIAVVEREDKAKGFIQNGTLLVVRRGKRQIVATSTELARKERTEALQILEQLGRAIASRLK